MNEVYASIEIFLSEEGLQYTTNPAEDHGYTISEAWSFIGDEEGTIHSIVTHIDPVRTTIIHQGKTKIKIITINYNNDDDFNVTFLDLANPQFFALIGEIIHRGRIGNLEWTVHEDFKSALMQE